MTVDPREKQAYLSATPMQREEVRLCLLEVLCVLRAQSLSYQVSHWQALGSSFYGNHLLFERLYNSVQGQIDQLAEKMVGYLGRDAVDMGPQLPHITGFCEYWEQVPCRHERGLLSESTLQDAIKAGYDRIKKIGAMTLGLDDWLMSAANAHEENTYLLQQVLAEPSGKTASTTPDRELAVLVDRLKRKYPEANLSYGYLGNVGRGGDDRSWYVFSKLSRPKSYGHKSYKWGGQSTENLDKLSAWAKPKLERAVQEALANNDGPYKGPAPYPRWAAGQYVVKGFTRVDGVLDTEEMAVRNWGQVKRQVARMHREGRDGFVIHPDGGKSYFHEVRSSKMPTPHYGSGAPSAEGHFFDNPEKREVREFADSSAVSNSVEVAEDAAHEDNLDLPVAETVQDALKAPPTPDEIADQPGGAELSTLNRFEVTMASWIRELDDAPVAT